MAHDTDVYVGKRLREARHSQGLTQTELADALGVKFQQVQKYETGANRISASRLLMAANYFDLDVSWFFPDQEPGICSELEFTRADYGLLRSIKAMNPEVRSKVEALVHAL